MRKELGSAVASFLSLLRWFGFLTALLFVGALVAGQGLGRTAIVFVLALAWGAAGIGLVVLALDVAGLEDVRAR